MIIRIGVFSCFAIFISIASCRKSELANIVNKSGALSEIFSDIEGPEALKATFLSYAYQTDSDYCKGDLFFEFYGVSDSIKLRLTGYHPEVDYITIHTFGDTVIYPLSQGFRFRKVYESAIYNPWLKFTLRVAGQNFLDSLYMPPPMHMYTIPNGYPINQDSSFEFRKSMGFTVHWNPDPFPNLGKGVLLYLDHPSYNHDLDSTLPNSQILKTFLDYDQASFQVTPQKLSPFPLCPVLTVSIVRGDYKIIQLVNSTLSVRVFEHLLESRRLIQ